LRPAQDESSVGEQRKRVGRHEAVVLVGLDAVKDREPLPEMDQ